MMLMKNLTRALVVAAIAGASLHAAADTLTAAKMKEMMSAPMMDTNKDGMVSRDEFLSAMGKVYDMKAQEMGAKKGLLDAKQIEALHRSIWQAAGGQ